MAVRVAMTSTRRTEPWPPAGQAPAPERATVAMEGGEPSEGGEAARIAPAPFGEFGDERQRGEGGPTPGTEVNRFSVSRQAGLGTIVARSSRVELPAGPLPGGHGSGDSGQAEVADKWRTGAGEHLRVPFGEHGWFGLRGPR